MRFLLEVKSKREKEKRSERLLFAFLLFILNLVSAAGCALFGAPDTAPLKQATARELMALLAEREMAIQTMKGLFSAKISGGLLPISQRVEGAVYYQRPNAIRLRGFNAFGGEVFEFVQFNDEYKLRLPTMGRELNGRPSESEKMGKLARPFQLSVWAMSGILGTTAIAPDERVLLVEDGDQYRLEVYARAEDTTAPPQVPTRKIWFDRRKLLVVREERLSAQGEVEATLQFDDFRPIGPPAPLATSSSEEPSDHRLLRPFKISMKDGQGPGSVHVTFHEIIPNGALQPGELGHV